MFTSVQHERIVATFERHSARFVSAGETLQMASNADHRAIWTQVFKDRDRPTTSYRPTWEFDRDTGRGKAVTVHDIFKELADAPHSFEHDVLYGALGSDIVHSGPFSLSRIMAMTNRKFVLRPMPVRDLCTIALASSNTAMLLVLDSFTQFLGLDLSNEITSLKEEAKANPYV